MLKFCLIGLYESVIRCKSTFEGELSNLMNGFVPYTIWKKRGGGERDKHWVELAARSAVCPVDLSP